MQRYRLNFKLLIGLLVGAVVVVGGVAGLYIIQAGRGAESLLRQAVDAREAGELRKERGFLSQYTRLRREDKDAAVRFAEVILAISELSDAEPSERGMGVPAIEALLRKHPDQDEMRRELIDILVKGGRAVNALDHVNYLLNTNPDDAELQEIRLRALVQSGKSAEAERFGFKLVGYDSTSDEFDTEQAVTPNQAGVYQALALLLRGPRSDPELADRVMDELIEVNPELSEAYFSRGQYLTSTDRQEEGKEDYEKALELDPNNVDALLAKAQSLSRGPFEDNDERDAAYEQAYELLTTAEKADATNWAVYLFLARLEAQRGDPEAAIAVYDRGIEAVEKNSKTQLSFYKARAQLDAGNAEGANETIKALEEMPLPQAFVDYLIARRLALEKQWPKAAEEFLRLRPTLSSRLDLLVELNIHMGDCFEKLGQFERALEAYDTVLQTDPSNRFVIIKKRQMMERVGKKGTESSNDQSINRVIAQELRKPANRQDWDAVFARIDNYAEKLGLPDGMEELLKAEVYVRRGDYEKAQKRVIVALKQNPENVNVWRSALRVIASDPARGPVKAIEQLDSRVIKKFGDSPLLRLDKSDFYIKLGDDSLTEQLFSLTEGIDDWDPQDQARLWNGLAQRFNQLRDQESRQKCLNEVVGLSPNSLPAYIDLFRAAISENDPERVVETQNKIAELLGSKEKATYLFTEATRLLWEVQRGVVGDEALSEAERLVERAMLERPEWHELYLLQARIYFTLGNKVAALSAFDEAAKRGPPNAFALLQHVSLLLERGRFVDAAEALQAVDEPVRQRLFGKSYAEILFNTGSVKAGLVSARKVIDDKPEDGATQLWFGRMCLKASSSPKLSEKEQLEARERAAAALSKAVELTPDNAEAWLSKIGYQIADKRRDDAEQTLRLAQLALSEDQLPLVLARSYEALGRWFDAEQVYLRMHEAKPDNNQMTRTLATFYLGNRYPRNDKRLKATPLINEILQSAASDPELNNDPNVMWARRQAAGLLATDNDYQRLLDAERLLASNVIAGSLSEDDKVLMARILASRPEPVSRVKAIRLFEEVQRNRILSLEDDLRLGQLYFVTENWDAARQQMLETIARNPQVPGARQRYISMLLAKGGQSNHEEASRQLSRLKMTDNTTLGLVVQVANKLGKQKQALNAVKTLVPKDLKKADPKSLLFVAGLLKDLGDLDNAEQLYRAVADRDPNAMLFLADFLGEFRDVEQAFDLLAQSVRQGNLAAAIRGGLLTVRARRADIGDTYDERVDSWLQKALRDDPESISFQLQMAELRDLQRRYDDAGDIYRSMLKQPDLEGIQRAVVLNNLGYLLALSARDTTAAEEAMGFVAEAVDILGPQADILDTRAVVHTALKQYRAAITDINLSLTDNPTASKFFHKSRVHMLADETQKAVKAWQKAVELGLTRETVATAEQEQYDEMEQKIARITQSAAG